MSHDPNALAASLERMNRLMGAMTAVVWSPKYEYSPVLTYGGPSGSFILPPVWPTPCEYRLVSVAANDAATVVLSQSPNPAAPAATETLDPTSGTIPRQVAVTAGAATLTYAEGWQALPAHAALYLATTVATSKAAWVSIQYRRRINPAGIPAEG